MDMDLGTIVIWLAAFVAVAAVSFLVSIFSFKEKTFEEALAEQRETDGSTNKAEKDKSSSKEKKTKRWVKKPKDKSGETAGSQPITEGKLHVEFEPGDEIITLAPPSPIEEKPVVHDKIKKEKVKPILRNRGEISSVVSDKSRFDPDVDSTNHFSEHPPKDDVELKGEHHKLLNGSSDIPSDNIEPEVIKTNASIVMAEVSPSTPKKDKKKKKKGAREAIEGDETYDSEHLLANLHKAVLSNSDIQMLIEELLNKQQENVSDAGWIEKGRWDPVSALKKQLTESEQQLQESREAMQAFQAKLKTMTTDLSVERNRAEQARRQNEEVGSRHQNEVHVLRQQHTMEMQALSNKLHALQNAPPTISEEHLRAVHLLQEEKASLEAHYSNSKKIQQEMNVRIQQLEDHLRRQDQQRREEEMTHQAQLNRLAGQLQEAEQSKGNLMMEVSQGREAQKMLQTLQHENSSLQEALRNAEAVANHTARDAGDKIEEAERTRKAMESHISVLEADLAAERQKSAVAEQLLRRIQQVETENETLNSQLKVFREQPSAEPAEALLNEKEQELQCLQKSLGELEARVFKAETGLQAAAVELEKSQRLESELEEQKEANNKLREKNWKVVEAVSKAEKSVEDLKRQINEQKAAAEAGIAEQKRQLQQIVKRVLPDCDVPIPKTGGVLEAIENVLNSVVTQRSSKEQPKEDVADLSNQVRHYKNVLAQTETLLRQLEHRVKDEETKWKNLLAEKVAALEAAERERDFFCKQNSQTSGQDGNSEQSLEEKLVQQNLKLGIVLQTQQNALKSERSVIDSLQQQLVALEGRVSDS